MDIFGDPPEKQSNNEKRLEAVIATLSLDIPEVALWCERQYKRRNPRRPDWPFYTDFRICVAIPKLESLLCMIEEDQVTDVNVEADGDYHGGMNERERDYYKDLRCMASTPTVRFGPQRIYKEADECIGEAIALLFFRHFDKIYKASFAYGPFRGTGAIGMAGWNVVKAGMQYFENVVTQGEWEFDWPFDEKNLAACDDFLGSRLDA